MFSLRRIIVASGINTRVKPQHAFAFKYRSVSNNSACFMMVSEEIDII